MSLRQFAPALIDVLRFPHFPFLANYVKRPNFSTRMELALMFAAARSAYTPASGATLRYANMPRSDDGLSGATLP